MSEVTFTYSRDKLGRLTQESISNDAYIWKPSFEDEKGTLSYIADDHNRYSSITTEGASNNNGTVTPTYDTRGNLTFDGTYSYSFDAGRAADVRSEARNVKTA